MIIFTALGIISSVFQLSVLREFSFSIAKNEISLALATGMWIFFCALGSIIKTGKKQLSYAFPFFTSLIFIISISLIHLARPIMRVAYYESISAISTLVLSLLLIGPIAFIIGHALKRLAMNFSESASAQNGPDIRLLAFEAMGFLIGGLSFTFYLNNCPNPMFFAILPVILAVPVKPAAKKILCALGISFLTVISALSFGLIIRAEFGNPPSISRISSRYSPLVLTSSDKTSSLFYAGGLLATSEDKQANEEFIHMGVAGCATAKNKKALFIGPAVSGQLNELNKYGFTQIDFVQIDPLLTDIAKRHAVIKTQGEINFFTADPRLFLTLKKRKYDVIMMNMPAPSSLGLNRFFTVEFFKIISKSLNNDGTFSFAIPSKREILSPQFIRFNSSIINAVRKVFPETILIPSDYMTVIASNNKTLKDTDLLLNFRSSGIKNDFFTFYHFRDYLDPPMRAYIEKMIDKTIPANTDLNPSGFLNYLWLEQSKFYLNLRIGPEKIKTLVLILTAISLTALAIINTASKKYSCFLNTSFAGFTAINANLMTLFLFQIYCGELFWKLGVFLSLFMASLSAGTLALNKAAKGPIPL